MFVTKQEDDYIIGRFEQHTRWIANLTNGERIYQDDGRPEVEPESAWLRLKEYVHTNKLAIRDLIIQFRSHIVQVNKEPVDGFFFRNKILGSFGNPECTNFFVVGTLKDGIVSVTSYQIPEIEVESTDTRKVEDCLDGLIFNYGSEVQV